MVSAECINFFWPNQGIFISDHKVSSQLFRLWLTAAFHVHRLVSSYVPCNAHIRLERGKKPIYQILLLDSLEDTHLTNQCSR